MTANTAQQVRPTGVEKKLRIIKINSILPSPHQTRIFPPDWEKTESTIEMVQSIKENGLFQPPLVRDGKSSGKIGKYILVAGERRLRCSKLAGLKDIPVIVTELSEKEAAKVTASENYHREDLSIIEEAAAIRVLLEAYDGDVKEVANHLDKSERWIRNWSRIANLEKCWQNEMQPNNNDEQLSRWKGGHWREIACFSEEVQKELYEEFKGKYWLKEVTVTQLKEHIAEYFCVIKHAIWPLHSFKGHTDKTCDICQNRSDAMKTLFEEEVYNKENAKCLNRSCFELKKREYILEGYHNAKKKYSDRLLVGWEWDGDSKLAEEIPQKVIRGWRLEEVYKKTNGARPVYWVSGDDICKITWAMFDEPEDDETETSTPETPEERAERKEREKKKEYEGDIVSKLHSMISYKFKPRDDLIEEKRQIKIEAGGEVKMPPLDILVRIIPYIDCSPPEEFSDEVTELLETLTTQPSPVDNVREANKIFRHVLSDEFAFFTNYFDSLDEVELLCRLFGLDFNTLKEEAERVLREDNK